MKDEGTGRAEKNYHRKEKHRSTFYTQSQDAQHGELKQTNHTSVDTITVSWALDQTHQKALKTGKDLEDNA